LNFPHCLGAIDGKHVVLECPANTGSSFFNYKETFSIILLAVVDANYLFNLLKPTGYVMHHQLNIQQLYALPTLYLRVLYLYENKQRLVPLTA